MTTTPRPTPPTPPWRSRIVDHANVAPAELVPNPRNWRTHPADQQKALTGAMSEVGSRRSGTSTDTQLFPDCLKQWDDQVAATERLAVMADRLAELDGAALPELDMLAAVAARVPTVVD